MAELKVVFSAVTNEFDRAMNKVSQQLNDVERKFQNLSRMGDRLSSVGRQLSVSLTVPIAALAATAGVAITKFANFADRISDLTQITGLSAKAIQEWQNVARNAGVDTEALTNAMSGLIRKLPTLEQETGISAEQLAKLGINLNQLKQMSPDDAIDTIMNALLGMENIMERNAVASALFGLAWRDIAPILGLGIDGIQKAKKQAHELGLVMTDTFIEKGSQINAQLEILKAQLSITFIEVGAAIAPILSSLSRTLTQLLPTIEALANAFAKLPQPLQQAIVISLLFLAALGPIISAIGALLKTIVALKTALTVLVSVSKSVLDVLSKVMIAVQGLSFAAKVLSGFIGFLIIDFITGAIQAERFRKTVEDLRQTMNYAASDAEKYMAAMQLWQDTKSVEALNRAIAILDKYNITTTDIIEKSQELGISYEEAAALLIRQAEATRQAAEQTDKLNSELSTLQKVQNKNLQTFDEVHTISKEEEKLSPFENLVQDIKDLGQAAKTVNLDPLKKSISSMINPADQLSIGLGKIGGSLGKLNPVLETSWGEFQLVDGQLQQLSMDAWNVIPPFQELSLTLPDINNNTSELSESIYSATIPGFQDLAFTVDSYLLPTIEAIPTTFETAAEDIRYATGDMKFYNEDATREIVEGFQDLAFTVDSYLLPTIEAIPTTFETAAKDIRYATRDMKFYNEDATREIVEGWENTQEVLVGNSIIPDMVSAIQTLFQGLTPSLNSTMDQVSRAVVGGFETISSDLQQELMPDIAQSLTSFNGLLENLGITAGDVEKTIKRAFENMSDDIADNLWNLLTGSQSVGDALKGIWEAVGNMFRYIFVQLMSTIITKNLSSLADWVAGVITQAAAAVGAFLSQAYAALVAFFAWAGPGAPLLAAAVMATAGAAIFAFASWAVGAIRNVLGLAEGGIVTRPTFAMVGEAGAEAVIPLNGTLAEEVEIGVFNAMMQLRGIFETGENAQQTITLEIDGHEFARTVIPYLVNEFDRIGIRLAEG